MLRLAAAEAAYVAAYLGRLRTWDDRSAVRLQARGGVVGIYAAPADDVVALVVVPLLDPVTGTSLDGTDVVVSAGRLRDVLGTVSGDRDRDLRLPDPVVGTAALAALPPRRDWRSVTEGTAADVAAAGSSGQGWGGLTPRAVQVAVALGFLPRPEVAVRTTYTGTAGAEWHRLETPGGQLFVRSGSPNLLA